jgi:hypothetical protein
MSKSNEGSGKPTTGTEVTRAFDGRNIKTPAPKPAKAAPAKPKKD